MQGVLEAVPRLLPFLLRRLSPVLQMRAGESSGWLAMKLSQPFANELSLQRRSADYNRRGKRDSICLCLSQITGRVHSPTVKRINVVTLSH
jgi:hypothetical protein